MGVLSRFEQRLGGFVEGAFAKVFKGGVEPVELASALTRECDQQRAISATRSLVPNQFAIALSAGDYERLAPYGKALGEELSSIVREHAEHQRYTFVGPVVVMLERDDALPVGVYHVHSAVNGGAPLNPRTAMAGDAAPGAAAGDDLDSPADGPAYADLPPRGGIRPRPPADADAGGHAGARLVLAAGGTARAGSAAAAGQPEQFPVGRHRITLGRGADCTIRLADTGVSRQHGEIRLVAEREHVYRDLGSTNGSILNGRPVLEARLEDGDRLQLGRSTLVYRKDDHARGQGREAGREGGEGSGSPTEA